MVCALAAILAAANHRHERNSMIELTLDRYVSGVAPANCDLIGMLAREAAAPTPSIATIGSARPGIQGKDPTEIPMSPTPR